MQEHRQERDTDRRKKAARRRAKRVMRSSLLDSRVSAHNHNNNARCRHKKQTKYATARRNSEGMKRHTLYTIETKSVLRLSDLLARFDSAERMELEREIVNALALNAQANYRRSDSDHRPSIGTSRYPSPSWSTAAAKESASGAVDDNHELTLARNSSTPCIIVEVEYYDPSCLTEEQMRKHASSTLTIVDESRV